MEESAARGSNQSNRLVSLDAYRGFVMLAMASGGLGLAHLSGEISHGIGWDLLQHQFDHVPWRGCSFWDLIQPSFMFIVGAAIPFAEARRAALGQSWMRRFAHAVWRSVLLVAIGVFLASDGKPGTEFVFTNVLAQIGLGYWFVFLVSGLRIRWLIALALLILIADWGMFVAYPKPSPGKQLNDYSLPQTWERIDGSLENWQTRRGQYPMRNFLYHWEKNTNIATKFDQWLLNRLPRVRRYPASEPRVLTSGLKFRFNDGGYQTLNFIPSIATMLFGVAAGKWLRAERSAREKVGMLFLIGAFCLILGTALDRTICPIVKRIWTPSWVIFSTAWTCWMLGLFYWIIDVRKFRAWAFPLVVVGMNPITIYLMYQLMKGWLSETLKRHVGTFLYWLNYRFHTDFDTRVFSGPYAAVYESIAILFVLWLICYWLYRRRIFIRI